MLNNYWLRRFVGLAVVKLLPNHACVFSFYSGNFRICCTRDSCAVILVSIIDMHGV